LLKKNNRQKSFVMKLYLQKFLQKKGLKSKEKITLKKIKKLLKHLKKNS